MRTIDFSSWHGLLLTLMGLALVTLIGVGIRLLAMMTIQQRRERLNRQINERLRALIAAYKTLGGSFTGNLTVDPTHRRDLRRRAGGDATALDLGSDTEGKGGKDDKDEGSDRRRRIRDAVEAALSDIILFGTADQVRLAAEASAEMVAGKPVHIDPLVAALRDYIRAALDLDPVPDDVTIPPQGPARPSGGGGRKGDGGGGGRGGGGGGGMGGMGGGMGGGTGAATGDPADPHHPG